MPFTLVTEVLYETANAKALEVLIVLTVSDYASSQ